MWINLQTSFAIAPMVSMDRHVIGSLLCARNVQTRKTLYVLPWNRLQSGELNQGRVECENKEDTLCVTFEQAAVR